MDSLEKRISRTVHDIAHRIEDALLSLARLVAIPLSLPGRFIRFSVPPALHIILLLSLLPPLFIFSVSSGVLVARWLPSGWSERVYLQYGSTSVPYGFVMLKNLAADQHYDVSLHLTLPCSESNIELGNFMGIVTFMVPSNNRTVSHSRRPALVACSASSFSFSKPSFTDVVIPLYEGMVPGYSSLRAKVEVGRPDRWRETGKGESKEVAIADAYLKGTLRARGLTSWLVMSPMMTSFATSALFFFTSTFIAFGLYAIYSPTFSWVTSEDEPEHDSQIQVASREPYPPGRPFKSSSKVDRRTPSADIKKEADEGFPSAVDRERMLRRRRSRGSERSTSAASSSRAPLGASTT